MPQAPPPVPAPPPNPPPSGSDRRARKTTRDLVISLALLLVPAVILVVIFGARGSEDVVVVDPSHVIAEARASNAFPVAVPAGLAPQWRSVSAAFTHGDAGAVLRVGYITPDGGAVQLIESNEPLDALVEREFGGMAQAGATVVVEGERWQSSTVRGGERALVSASPERTMIIVGRASLAELETLAAALT